MMTEKRIAFIYPYWAMDSKPSLPATIMGLADAGFSVDVFITVDSKSTMPRFDSKAVRMLRLIHLPGGTKFLLVLRAALSPFMWLPRLLLHFISHRPTCIVGAGDWGLFLARCAGTVLNIRYIYFNLELYFLSEIDNPLRKLWKRLESSNIRRSAFCITQDRMRAKLFSTENSVPLRRIVTLPNSPAGEPKRLRSRVIYDKLRIPDGKRIALQIGPIEARTMCLELAQAARMWSEPWVLVLHSAFRLGRDPYAMRVRQLADNRKVYLCDTPVQRAGLRQYLSSSCIGIAMYVLQPHNVTNERSTGLSSGKIAAYLQCGLPIVTVDFPSLRWFVDQYRCGVCVSSPNEIKAALETIQADYAGYSERALACFSSLFSFELHFEEVKRRIRGVEKGQFPPNDGKSIGRFR